MLEVLEEDFARLPELLGAPEPEVAAASLLRPRPRRRTPSSSACSSLSAMSELGDLLELMHAAHRSFEPVCYEAREWRHTVEPSLVA